MGENGGLFRYIGAYVAFALFVHHSLVVLVIAIPEPFEYTWGTIKQRRTSMTDTKNLCAQIPIALHEQVSEERERLGQTTSEYIINLI